MSAAIRTLASNRSRAVMYALIAVVVFALSSGAYLWGASHAATSSDAQRAARAAETTAFDDARAVASLAAAQIAFANSEPRGATLGQAAGVAAGAKAGAARGRAAALTAARR